MRFPSPLGSSARRRMSGLAAVELVLVVPIVLILLMGTAELGRAIYQYNTLSKAVRDGARYLAGVATRGDTGVVNITGADATIARNLVVYGTQSAGTTPLLEGLAPGDVVVADAGGGLVSVTATYDYAANAAIFGFIPTFGFGADVAGPGTMTASSLMPALK